MDSSSKLILFRLLDRTIDFVHEEAIIAWGESHVSIVYDYILKLSNINSEFRTLKELPFGEDLSFSCEMVQSFMQDLQKFFLVPKFHELYVSSDANALNKKELLAAFIHFLLQLLSHKTDFVHPLEDRIDHLKKELKYLITILGDRSLLCAELEEVNNLLAQFESVANEAGRSVYSFFFATDEVFIATRMDDTLVALLRDIDHLRGNIINLSLVLPHINETKTTPEIAINVDSLFIVDSLLHDLEVLMTQNHNLIVDVKGHIKVLHQQLMLSQSFLEDIKVPRHVDIKELKRPVMQIRDLAYEAEYLVNSFLVGHVPCEYLTIRLPDIIHKIKLVGIEFQEIKKNYDIGVLKFAEDQLFLQAQRNPDVNGINVMVGSEDKTTHVLHQLVGGTRRLQIIIIFGMPGLGKTTLAKKLYNHPTINCYFDKCSFCVVSQTYQRKNLLIDILIILGTELDRVEILDMKEECLGESIYKFLKGRRYFIVMDDVWDSKAWDDFRRYFPDDRNGSRILFTSRNKDVAPPNSIIYGLPSLSNDECWELLQKKVFEIEPCPPELIGIGKKIAANCNGLPLAVVVVSGILSTMDKEENAWKNVGRSLASYIFSGENNSTMQILKLSYTHLPDHLKPCFLYFGVFPGNREIPVKKLKCLWRAERFVNKEEILKNGDSLAEDYLMELIDRSLVMVVKKGSDSKAKTCIVHDLLRDLCLRLAEEENFFKFIDRKDSIYTRHHRLHVRNTTFLPFGHHIRSLFVGPLGSSSLDFLNLNLLILLDLPRNKIRDDDRSEHLVHLRYLAIQCMPSSIGNFVNLEFLIVMGTLESSVSISSVIQKLVKLKYLSVPNAYFDKNCNGYQINNLEFLATVRIDKAEDEKMLKCSPHLHKLKCKFAALLDEHGKYRHPDIRFLTHLESLNVSNLSIGASTEINLPSNIKKLTLQHLSLPCEIMSMIGGLPKLEILKLECGTVVGGTWGTRDGEFEQLKFLKLSSIDITEWNVASSEHFPRLQRLILWSCYNLQEIPSEIGEIATLQLIDVLSSRASVVESATKIRQEQQEMGNEELNVIIS